MKVIKIKWTPFSISKLSEIYNHIYRKEQSHSLATRQLDRLIDGVSLLKDQPEIGPVEPLLKIYSKGHRFLVADSYKIIYRQEGNIILILDVFHTSQHPRKIKRNRKK